MKKNKLSFKYIKIAKYLSICITFSIIWLLVYQIVKERTFNNQFKNRNSIFRVLSYTPSQDFINTLSPTDIGEHLINKIPEIKATTRINWINKSDIYFEKRIIATEEYLCAVDTSFASIFSLKTIQGDFNQLNEPNTIAVTESIARKIPGVKSLIGERLILNNEEEESFRIVAIIEDLPESSTIRPRYLVKNLRNDITPKENEDVYSGSVDPKLKSSVYILLEQQIDFNELLLKANRVIKELKKKDYEIRLQNIKDVHFHRSRFPDNTPTENNYKEKYKLLSIAIILILLVGITNHIILSLSSLSSKLKAIGIKQSYGASLIYIRRELLLDSIKEIIYLMPVSILIVYLLFPKWEVLFDFELSISSYYLTYTSVGVAILIIVYILISTLSILYLIRKRNPIKYLQGEIVKGFNNSLVEVLALIQIISFVILSGFIIVIQRQIEYSSRIQTNIYGEDLYVLRSKNQDLSKLFPKLKHELLNTPFVTGVSSCASGIPTITGAIFSVKHFADNTLDIPVHIMIAHNDFLQTLNIKLIDGRYFSHSSNENSGNCIINQSLVKSCGLENPTDEFILNKKIIGVVQDFNIYPIDQKIPPLVIIPSNNIISNIYFRTSKDTKIPKLLELVLEVSQSSDFELLDFKTYNDFYYKSESSLGALISHIALVNLIICVIGLLGLSMFISDKQKFELAIRRVYGSTIRDAYKRNLLKVLLRIAIANILAFPITMLVAKIWLQNFEYFEPLKPTVFFMPFIITALITVASNLILVFQHSRTNPVDLLG